MIIYFISFVLFKILKENINYVFGGESDDLEKLAKDIIKDKK